MSVNYSYNEEKGTVNKIMYTEVKINEMLVKFLSIIDRNDDDITRIFNKMFNDNKKYLYHRKKLLIVTNTEIILSKELSLTFKIVNNLAEDFMLIDNDDDNEKSYMDLFLLKFFKEYVE